MTIMYLTNNFVTILWPCRVTQTVGKNKHGLVLSCIFILLNFVKKKFCPLGIVTFVSFVTFVSLSFGKVLINV